MRRRLRLLANRCTFALTRAQRKRWTKPKGLDLEQYLRETYFPSWFTGVDPKAFLASPAGRNSLRMHLSMRLELDRYQFVPWINSLLDLERARILEIGCGTGSATVSLAEQGAQVTALDLHEEALEATRIRCRMHGVEGTTRHGNAQDLGQLFQAGQFDLIVFFAVLEHMTLAERLASLKAAWALLKPGQHLCITDTPNRLWPYDSHTSYLPFFHWLPDELAIHYSAKSPRFPFNTQFRAGDELTPFIRQGRGVSFHECQLALGELAVAGDQTAYLSARNPIKLAKRLVAGDARRERWLNGFEPKMPRAWFRQNLNIIVRKATTES